MTATGPPRCPHLIAGGRYDRPGAAAARLPGRFWIDGDRIDCLDDLGFWAYKEFQGDELHHTGHVMKLS